MNLLTEEASPRNVKFKYPYAELKRLWSLPLEDKILRSEQIILYELKSHHSPCVACSWGKCSVVLLHLVRRFCEKVLVMFNNTGVEYPETYQYRDYLLKEWDIENYVESKPIKSFWQCVKEYGYPNYRIMGGTRRTAKKRVPRTPKCCYYCKEGPARKNIKKLRIDLQFVGLQASESMVRRLSFLREGESFDSKTWGCRIVRPLMIWTDDDLWAYHKKFGVPRNPLYDKTTRNGCMPCTGFKNWKKVMAKTSPKIYEFVSKSQGQPLLTDCRFSDSVLFSEGFSSQEKSSLEKQNP